MNRHLHATQKVHQVFKCGIAGWVTPTGDGDTFKGTAHQLEVSEHIIRHITQIFETSVAFPDKIGAVITPDRKRQAVFAAKRFGFLFLADSLKVTVFTESLAVQTGPATDIYSQVCHDYVLF